MFSDGHSGRHSRQPLELNQPADVVTEVHHPDLKPRPRDADGAHDLAAHRVLLVAEYVLDTRAHPRARRVRRLLALRQRTISCGAPVDTALQALRLQARLNLHRAVGAVRPDPLAGIGEIEHIVQLLTVVHGRVRRIPFADQLVRLVHAEVVLVAVEALVVPLRPARVLVLLGIPGGLLLPKRTWNPGRCHHSRFYEYTPFCNGPVDVNCSPIVTPPSSRFCPWSTLRPPHYAVRGSGEPI